MSTDQLPVENLLPWAHINGVEFYGTSLENVPGKGAGLFAGTHDGTETLLQVPQDLILSVDAVEEYAKVDQNFRQLLDAAGHHSTRGDILLYLLAHIVCSRHSKSSSGKRGIAPTPWSEYVKFLPRAVPLPTAWPEHDRFLLRGTSLETALQSKLAALAGEFESLTGKMESLPFWSDYLVSVTLDDWLLVDFWYRSRCLELPQAGSSMVPALDMVNHADEPNSYYEQTSDGVVLLPRPSATVNKGDEITISYGQNKSAAELLFSYGFIDEDTSAREMTLPLHPLEDDPLGKAKVHAWNGARSLKLSRVDSDTYAWEAPFLYLMVLNEEDGLDFRVLQEASAGERQLRVFWQDDDVTERLGDIEALVDNHALHRVIELRAVVLTQERVETQLEALRSALPDEMLEAMIESELVDKERARMARTLRGMEGELLEAVLGELEKRKASLLEDESVLAYLGSAAEEPSPAEQAPAGSANDEDDFS